MRFSFLCLRKVLLQFDQPLHVLNLLILLILDDKEFVELFLHQSLLGACFGNLFQLDLEEGQVGLFVRGKIQGAARGSHCAVRARRPG